MTVFNIKQSSAVEQPINSNTRTLNNSTFNNLITRNKTWRQGINIFPSSSKKRIDFKVLVETEKPKIICLGIIDRENG